MKKKIAVYASGWSRGALFSALEGIRRYSEKQDFDVFVFMSHAVYSEIPGINEGELNIYRLGDLGDFDGAIIFSPMLNSQETVEALCKEGREKRIPVVSIGMEVEGAPCVSAENEVGMRELVTHLVEVHGVKRVVFIAGNRGHQDSETRLRVTQEVLREHGLELKEADIRYGNWGNDETIRIVDELIESQEGLPDAIVCANDYMALAAETELASRGYRVPEDVAVTGFDCVEEGKVVYPALSSVDSSYAEIGYQCCEIIYGTQDYEEKSALRIVKPSRAMIAESCGCLGNRECEERRRDYCKFSYLTHTRINLLDQMQRTVQLYYILTARDYESLKRNLQRGYENNHLFEGPNFSMVLNRHYFENVMMDESEFRKKTVIEGLDVVFCLKDGKNQESQEVTRQVPAPGYQKEGGVQHVYYFLPLHAEQYNYGYLIFRDTPMLLTSDVLYSYLERLKESMKNLRINLRLDAVNRKLTQIYDKDPMTGLFNRFGYENKALPLYEHCQSQHSTMMVMFVDINYMKRINDVYGHIHGDNAIRIVADSIKANLRQDWLAVRFGGDEFLIIAPDCDKVEAETVKQDILDYLERKNGDGTRRYRISASCGYVLTDPDRELVLQDYIREADTVMYEIKRQVHAHDKK